MADKAENKENVKASAVFYQEQERDCDAESLDALEYIWDLTDNFDTALAVHDLVYDACWNDTH